MAVREILMRELSTLEIKSGKATGRTRDGIGQDAIKAELRDVPGISGNGEIRRCAFSGSRPDEIRVLRL
jgi:hypothetical protein